MGIRDRPISPRSPWQNPYVERAIGTLRRECLDHVLIFGERHLRWNLTLYSLYYNETRTHLGLEKDAPATTSHPTIWDYHRHTDLVRVASSLRPDMIFGKDRDTWSSSLPMSRISVLLLLSTVSHHRSKLGNKVNATRRSNRRRQCGSRRSCSRSLLRWTLPVAVRGRLWAISNRRGRL